MEFTRLGQGLIIEQDKDISIVEYELEENDDEIEEDSLDEDGNQKVSVDRKSEDLSVSHAVLPRKKIPKRKMAHVKTTDVNDELGQIEFICTDKTGTLTKNKMELKSLFVDGVEFINTKLFANLYEQELKKKERRERSGAVESMDSLVKAAFDSDKNEEARKSVHRNSTSKSKNGIFFLDFCLGLLVCNDIVVTRNDGIDASKGKYIYQSLSPDEIAFAEAMDSAGVTLCDSNDKMKVISLNGNGKRSKEKYIIHGMLGFSADRKRMSVVVEDSLGVKKLLCKGADSMLKTFLNGNDELTNQHVKQTDDALSRFASDGNRTLMLVSRTLCESEFNSWKDAFTDASVSVSNRELKIEKSFALIENNMRLLGCTSVEDPLQDGVPESIDALLAANIVVVVLTGDKQETAVAIGKQSRIIQPDAELFFISSEEVASLEFELSKILKSKASHRGHIAIIISGNALEVAIREKRDLFLSALAISQTVVCSRTTPHQKAGMVLLVKRHLKKIVLAIGDGANDVSMLQKANVGVGLTGKEGTQAAQTADFVLHRFRHLPRLLFIHGRFSYIRMSKVVLWSFYKNTLFPLPLLLFGFFSVFSDMRLYDSLLMTSFNMFFTSLPPFAIGWTEKDAPESFILSNPSLYHKFRILDQFNLHRFVRWLSLGVVQGLIIYWFAFGVFFDTDVISSDGKVSGLWVFGHWIYTAITFVITGTFLLTAANWTRLLLVSCFLGPAVYLLGWSVVGYSFDFSPEIYGLPPYLLGVAKSYFFQILVFALCVVPIFLHNLKQRYIKRTYIYELMDAQSS